MKTEKRGARRALRLGSLLALGGMLALGGCNLVPEAQSDPTRFFVLSVPAVETIVAAKPPVVHLRPIELASYIKSKPMIVRRSNNEIEFREYARWGEPLEFGIGRVLREDGSVIAGLFAAGNTSASIMARTYPGAGGTIGPALCFGMLSAEAAAEGAPAAAAT